MLYMAQPMSSKTNLVRMHLSGERGIRTLGTVASTPAFQAGSFDHSDISPFM